MGFTRYVNMSRSLTKSEWLKLVKSVKPIFDKHHDLIQRESDDPSLPLIDNEIIMFNGKGKDGHETCAIQREKDDFYFCKTNGKPYDKVVDEIYQAFRNVAPDAVEVTYDGEGRECSDEIYHQGLKFDIDRDYGDDTGATFVATNKYLTVFGNGHLNEDIKTEMDDQLDAESYVLTLAKTKDNQVAENVYVGDSLFDLCKELGKGLRNTCRKITDYRIAGWIAGKEYSLR